MTCPSIVVGRLRTSSFIVTLTPDEEGLQVTMEWRRAFTASRSRKGRKMSSHTRRVTIYFYTLFVFSISGPKQNGRSSKVTFDIFFRYFFYVLLHGSLSFAVHGSYFNHFIFDQNFSTTNHNL